MGRRCMVLRPDGTVLKGLLQDRLMLAMGYALCMLSGRLEPAVLRPLVPRAKGWAMRMALRLLTDR
jgi:hypothetical protein